jgi:Zn-dependent protease with chaperone function
VEKPVIVLNCGAVERLEEDELLFVIAHEMGHIKSGHVLYYQIASYIPRIGGMVGEFTMGWGNLLTMGLQVALLHWQRTAELTSDRAGLLACQDKDAALRALMKLAGMPEKYAAKSNLPSFIQQATEFEAFDLSTVDKIAKYVSISNVNHPWTLLRAKELIKWRDDSEGYDRVLNLPYPLKMAAKPAKTFCDKCGKEAASTDSFCNKCGNKFPPPAHPSQLP